MLRRLVNGTMRRIAVRANVTIGSGFHVGPGSTIWAPQSLVIGKDVYVGKNVTIEVDGRIGDGVLFANLAGIVGRSDHDLHDLGSSVRRSRWVGDFPVSLSRETVIGSDVWLGYGAIVLSGVSVGDSSIIGSGAVVVGDVPANSIVVGNPARVVGQRFSEDELALHWAALTATGHRILVGQAKDES